MAPKKADKKPAAAKTTKPATAKKARRKTKVRLASLRSTAQRGPRSRRSCASLLCPRPRSRQLLALNPACARPCASLTPARRQVESYKIYIYKVLKQVHPDTGISSKAMSIMCAPSAAPPAARAAHREPLSAAC